MIINVVPFIREDISKSSLLRINMGKSFIELCVNVNSCVNAKSCVNVNSE